MWGRGLVVTSREWPESFDRRGVVLSLKGEHRCDEERDGSQ